MAIRRCPYCKAIIDESQKYCNNCGTQLLFPEDEQNEEPIKGERIVDADFKDVDDDSEEDEDRLLTEDDAEFEEIDLEEVLGGAGHFPDEERSKPKSSRAAQAPKPEPESAPEPEPGEDVAPPAKPARKPSPKSSPRAPKKPAAPKSKQDTQEEIARLIAVLEEKERLRTDLAGDADAPPLPPEPAVIPMADKPTGLGSAWAELLEKPPSGDIDGEPIEIPRVPDTSPEADFDAMRGFNRSFRDEPRDEEEKDAEAEEAEAEEDEVDEEDEDKVFEPPASFAPGDTMDFQNEVLAATPLDIPSPPAPAPASEPTRMGIPERITREEIFHDRDENETPPESVFDGLRLPPDAATAPTSELLTAGQDDNGEPAAEPRRLGFFRKTAALLFDVIFIGAVWAVTLWLAALLLGVAPADLVASSPVPAGILLAALLGGYFFLFLFFLGETLGDRMASRKS